MALSIFRLGKVPSRWCLCCMATSIPQAIRWKITRRAMRRPLPMRGTSPSIPTIGTTRPRTPDPTSFGWGHSMGGGITLRVLTVGADVQGAVLYGAMSGDERRNFEQIRDVLSDGERGNEELTAPEEALHAISPINFYDRISVPVSIHHGDIDETVPPAWSTELCSQLLALGKLVECFSYHNMPHTFYGSLDTLLIERSIE